MNSLVAVEEANRCVACGLCLPACPTYRKLQSEADSPRGRVMLMRVLLDGTLSAEQGVVTHLDRCLTCRSCEAACPSGVKYGALIDSARASLVRNGRRRSGLARWLPGMLSSPALLGLSGRLRFRASYPARRDRCGVVSLFLGCATQLADAETLRASIFVLTQLGYQVNVPRDQGCCGAIHQHEGELDRARALASANIAAFGKPISADLHDLPPVLFSASGCGASLVEYGGYSKDGAELARRSMDIVTFLSNAQGWEVTNLVALDETILVHEPCSARNVLRNAADCHSLLSRIPQARIVPLPGNDQCCGAGGLYFMQQPEMATALQADKINAVRDSGARYLVSTNYGCARWITKGLRSSGQDVEVIHPVSLLAMQMGYSGRR